MLSTRTLQTAALAFIFIFTYQLVWSQTKTLPALSTSAEIKALWLKKIEKDSYQLKLPENRAYIFARLGTLYWKIDQVHARQLFAMLPSELKAAQRAAENSYKLNKRPSPFFDNNARLRALREVIKADANLGLDLFEQTRPPTIVNAFNGIPPAAGNYYAGSYNNLTPLQNIIQFENELEMQLLWSTVNRDPQRAAAFLRRGGPGILSGNGYSLLNLIHQKDPALAAQTFKVILAYLLAADFTQDPTVLHFVNSLLSASFNDKVPSDYPIDVGTQHRLAEKAFSFLQHQNISDKLNGVPARYIAPTLIRILPEREEEIRALTTTQNLPTSLQTFITFPSTGYIQLLDLSTPPEKVLNEASNYSPEQRDQLYIKAAGQIAGSGDLTRARKILTEYIPAERTSGVEDLFIVELMRQAAFRRDYEKALVLTSQISETRRRFNALIVLAGMIDSQTPNDRQRLDEVLKQAESFSSALLHTHEEFIRASQLADFYLKFDERKGFAILAVLVEKSNQQANAAAVTDSFENGEIIRNQEYLLNNNGRNLIEVTVSVQNFAKVNLGKTLAVLDHIERPEFRINALLKVLESSEVNAKWEGVR